MRPVCLRILSVLAFSFCLSIGLSAQSNKLIRELEGKRGDLQKQIAETEDLLKTAKKNVGSQLNGLALLTGQIEERKRYIQTLNRDMESIDRELSSLNRQLNRLERDLKEKRKRYEASVQYLYKNRSIEEKLMFIFSAQDLRQTYRRLRYVREYATYQRLQGEDILRKQQQIVDKKTELGEVKSAKAGLLKEREAETAKLEAQEKQQKQLVASLQKKQRNLQNEIARKRKEARQLNAKIDKLIAEEVEKASKSAATGTKTDKAAGSAANAAEVKALSGTFASNKGKLPMPVTGACLITSRYGEYAVAGLRGVKLDNKGIDIQARPGAQARAVFNGKVAAVFQLNGLFNVLVRHGSYITVYCNLSAVSVKAGDELKTGQNIGPVFSDKGDNNRTVLHFQLRKETAKLNPEAWLAR